MWFVLGYFAIGIALSLIMWLFMVLTNKEDSIDRLIETNFEPIVLTILAWPLVLFIAIICGICYCGYETIIYMMKLLATAVTQWKLVRNDEKQN